MSELMKFEPTTQKSLGKWLFATGGTSGLVGLVALMLPVVTFPFLVAILLVVGAVLYAK